MMNVEQIREAALSLCGVTEDQPFGPDIVTFRVEGKIFLCLWLDEYDPKHNPQGEQCLALKLAPERNDELRCQYAAITPAYHWNKRHWSDLHFTRLPSELVSALIAESHRLIISHLPKAQRAKYAIKN